MFSCTHLGAGTALSIACLLAASIRGSFRLVQHYSFVKVIRDEEGGNRDVP